MENINILNRVSKLERDLKTPISRSSGAVRNARMDRLVSDLANPKSAEQLRMFRLVEAQFDAIEEEVTEEVFEKLDRQRRGKDDLKQGLMKAEEVLKKSVKLRKEEARKSKVTTYKKSAIPKLVSPRKPGGKVVSFNENPAPERESKFEVLQEKDINTDMVPLASPVIIDRSRRGLQNQGLFQVGQQN